MDRTASRIQASMTTYRVLVLGPFALYDGDVSLSPGKWPPRAQSLLKLTVTAPDYRRSRDEIIDALWPESSLEAGSTNLRYTLHLLRRMFGNRDPTPILFEKHLVALNPAYRWEVDLDQFERMVRRAGDDARMLEWAAQFYRGEPLIEDRYADWAIPVRERIQRLWRDVCLRLASLHRKHSAWRDAMYWYDRILESDTLDEEAMVGIIEVLIASNRLVEARRRYKQFAKRLDDHIGAQPGLDLQAAALQLERHRHVSASPPRSPKHTRSLPVVPTYNLTPGDVLVGRERELHSILVSLPHDVNSTDESQACIPRLILLAAEAGMGKTRLLAEVAERARAEGILTLAGGCYEQEGHLPYGPVHDALLDYIRVQPEAVLSPQFDGLLNDLGRILPGLEVGTDDRARASHHVETERIQLFYAIAQLLERISYDRPIVLLLDDLQWADDATLQLLHYLSRQRQLGRVCIVGAYRTEELLSDAPLLRFLDGVQAGGQARVLALGPLSQGEISRMLEERLGGTFLPDFIHALHERSMGNPFFALQIVRLLRESGRLTRDGDSWVAENGESLQLPPAVRKTIARRLRGLGPDEREALSLGAVLGREIRYSLLEAMWEGDECSLFQAMDTAADTHLVHEVESGYAFSHPLLWEVVYWRIPAARRALLHERAGLKLEAYYGDAAPSHAAELAYHFQSAGQVHLDRAVKYLTLAGDAALRAYAWNEALTAYTSALEFAVIESAVAELQEKRGQVLKALARFDEALAALQQASELYRGLGDLDGESRSIVLLALVHHFRESRKDEVAWVKRAADHVQRRAASPYTLSRISGALARVHLLSGQIAEGLQAAELAVAQAIGAHDSTLLADALLVHGRALIDLGRLEDGVAAYSEARSLAEVLGDLFTVAATLDLVGAAYRARGKLLQAEECYERALSVELQRGGLELVESTLLAIADLHLFLGNWVQARTYVQHSFDLLGRSEKWTEERTVLATLALYEGNWDQLQEDVGEPRAGAHVRPTALLAEMNLLNGKGQEALAQLNPFVGDPAAESDARFLLPLTWAFNEIGNLKAANEVLARAEVAAEKRSTYVPDVLRIEGMLLARQDRWDDAGLAFTRAATEAHALPYPYSEARAYYEHGIMQIQKGELQEARKKLDLALALFQRLGARPYIERTMLGLRNIG